MTTNVCAQTEVNYDASGVVLQLPTIDIVVDEPQKFKGRSVLELASCYIRALGAEQVFLKALEPINAPEPIEVTSVANLNNLVVRHNPEIAASLLRKLYEN